MSAPAIARQLGGDLVWEHIDGQEWAALIRFHRSVEAELQPFAPRLAKR